MDTNYTDFTNSIYCRYICTVTLSAGFINVKARAMKRINRQSDFFYNEFGETISQGGNPKKVLISDAVTNQNYNDDKFIRSREKWNSGTLLEYKNQIWMIVSQINEMKSEYRARVRRTDWNIHFYISNVLYGLWCFAEDTNVKLDENKVMTLSADEIKLTVPYTEVSKQLAIGNRFLKFGAAWKITGFDRTKQGLMTIYAEKDLFNDYDDRDNEIADRWRYETKHSYSISFTNANQMTFNIGDTKQMEYEIKDMGVAVTNTMQVIFTSSNEEVAVINAGGLITAIGVGNSNVTVALADNMNISATCGLFVEEIPIVQEYTITLVYPSTTVKVGANARKFSAEVYCGNNIDSSKQVQWWVTDLSGNTTDMVTLSVNGCVCYVQAVDEDYIDESVVLHVALTDDNTVTNTVKILIAGIF